MKEYIIKKENFKKLIAYLKKTEKDKAIKNNIKTIKS